MRLRSRLTLLVGVLLAGVLFVVGAVLVNLDARDMSRRLEERAMDRARLPASPAAEAPAGGAASDEVRTLPPEPDGASLVTFAFDPPAPGEPAPGTAHALRYRASTPGAPRIERAEAEARLVTPAEGRSRRAALEEVAGTTWQVAVDTLPPAPDGPRGRRGPPGPGDPPPRAPWRGPPRPATVVVFLEASPALAEHRAFVLRTVLTCLAALGGGCLLAWLLAGRALRPVASLAVAAERIGATRERLPGAGSQDEVARLAEVLNGMLGRLDAAGERERAFLATASHELRRPLAALLGELELASAPGRDTDALREAVRLSHEDARGMARLVDDLLHHARARAGTLRVSPAPVNLRDVVRDAVDRSRRAVGGTLAADVEGVPAATVDADPDALRRVIENLVVNAATHGGRSVQVRVHGAVTDAGVVLHVEDDGAGIAPEDLPRLFEPFGRGDRASGLPGFGLGLAIVRDLVEAHGGRVEVVSPASGDPARPGARFTVRLPRAAGGGRAAGGA